MAATNVRPYRMSEIKSKLLQPALTSHYVCQFNPPKRTNDSPLQQFQEQRKSAGFLGADWDSNQELIELSCCEASLPGSSLATTDINGDYTGVSERHAYRRLYDQNADFTFYVDVNHYIIDYFESWLSFIVGENDIKRQRTPNYNYRINFPDFYKSDYLSITKFEKDYSGRYLTYQFINAFPISINSIPVSYDSSQLLKCTVSFNYSRYVLSRDIIKKDDIVNGDAN
jgi:hypothetical protein